MILTIPHSKGFTLLETITSVAILALVIIGPLAAIMTSSSYARQAKDTIVANYLAEESVELLQNQYDSLYILCKKSPTDPFCATATGETSGQIAWRLFKERLGAGGGGPSCYFSDNPDGCSYDYVDMVGPTNIIPTRYAANSNECPYLIEATSTVTYQTHEQYLDQQNILQIRNVDVTEDRHNYVCKGVAAHITGVAGTKAFARKISIDQIAPAFATGEMLTQDDLRITSTVAFKVQSGATTSVKIIRFMHAQP